MEVRPFSGHRHREAKLHREVSGRPTGPGKDTAGPSGCGSDRTGRLAAPAYESVIAFDSGRPESVVIL